MSPRRKKTKKKTVEEFVVSGPLAKAVTTLREARRLARLGLVKVDVKHPSPTPQERT